MKHFPAAGTRAKLHKVILPVTAVSVLFLPVATATAANITWIGGNVSWSDGAANNANWSPADEPDTDDTAIFNTANAVSLGSNNAILGLTMSAGMDLLTNAFNLDVNGLVQLTGSSTNLVVGGAASVLSADSITVSSLGRLQFDGGTVQVNEESGDGLLNINTGGELLGHGILNMTDAVAANTTLIVNDGTITARSTALIIFGAPPAGTLSLNATDADARIDLDGTGEAGEVTVSRNQTLDLNIPLADTFSGSMSLFHESVLDMSAAWTLAGGSITADNGFIAGVFPNPSVPAGVSTLKGPAFTQTGGTITVVDGDGTLQFDAPFNMTGGTLNNNGLVVFNANATIGAAAGFNMPGNNASITVGAGRTVQIQQTNFDLDGPIVGGSTITVNEDGAFNITSVDYDSTSVVNAFNGIINLNGGDFHATSGDAEFVMDGVLNMNSAANGFSVWSGEPLDIGNDAGALNAKLNVSGPGDAQISAQVDFNSDADVDVAAGAYLSFLSTVTFDTVNGASNAEFTGAGTIEFNSTVNVNEAVVLSMAGGTVDLDGADGTGDVINVDAPFTINAANFNAFGRVNGGGGVNTLDINNSVGTGVLTVNLDDPAGEWTLNPAGVMNLVNDNTEATLLAGSDVNLNGTVNVTGDVRTAARVDLGSTAVINILTAGQPFRLAGGNDTDDFNTISGATISGAGLLGADTGKALHGFGTINTGVDFDGAADLRADNGTLVINGAIVDVGQIGTADTDGVLQVTNAWNDNVSTGVQVRGGTLSGGVITNDVVAGISGYGLVSARVINNTQLFASIGDTLLVQTAGNDNDWDGTTGTGEIEAVLANIEIRDNATFGFTGTVSANAHRAFANGFALDFNPGSTLALTGGGIYESTSSTDLGGTVTIGVGGATVKVTNNFFLTFQTGSTTTLNGDLNLINNNIIFEAGATFSGNGALIIPTGSHFLLDTGANVNALVVNQGSFRPSNSGGVGRVDFRDYQQTSTGSLFTELTGANLNQFDRIVVNGSAQLAGNLDIDIDGGFVPVAGQTFDIITATGGISGHFNQISFSGQPVGVTFQVTYGATFVRVAIVGGTQYDLWIQSFASLTNPADRLKTADPDHDGVPNYIEFAMAGDPTKGTGMDKIYTKITPVSGTPSWTVTFPTRYPAKVLGIAPPMVVDAENMYTCFVEAGDDLSGFSSNPVLLEGANASSIQSSLPVLPEGWVYVSFRSPTPLATDSREFIRLRFTE